MEKLLLVVALALGGMVTYVDSRPTWDDTGITAGVVLALSAAFGFLGPKRPWAWALALGGGIPLVGIVQARNYGALIALVIAFAGAYAGMALRRVVTTERT